MTKGRPTGEDLHLTAAALAEAAKTLTRKGQP
jgi:hypothetical protein